MIFRLWVHRAVVNNRKRRRHRTQKQRVTRGQLVALGRYTPLTLPVRQAEHPGYLWKPGAPQVLCKQSKIVHGRSYLPPVLKNLPKFPEDNAPLLLRWNNRWQHLYPARPIVLQLTVGRSPNLPRPPPNSVIVLPLPSAFTRSTLVHTGRKVQTETSPQGQELAYVRATAALPIGRTRTIPRRADIV